MNTGDPFFEYSFKFEKEDFLDKQHLCLSMINNLIPFLIFLIKNNINLRVSLFHLLLCCSVVERFVSFFMNYTSLMKFS